MTAKIAIIRSDGLRTCSKCGSAHPPTYEHFFKHSQRSDGLHSWCKPCCKEGNRRSLEKAQSSVEGRAKAMLRNCQNSAEKRGQVCELTVESFRRMWDAQSGVCAYTGCEMSLRPGANDTMSIERIDSSLGYIEDNCVLVCAAVNRMKSDLPATDFYEFCRDVVRWLGDDQGELAVDWKRDG